MVTLTPTQRGMEFVLATCAGLGLAVQPCGEEEGLAAAFITGGADEATGAVRRLDLRVLAIAGPLARPAGGQVAVDIPETTVRRWAAAPDPVALVAVWPDSASALWLPVKERCGPPRSGAIRRLWLRFEADRFDGRFGGILTPGSGESLTVEEVFAALYAVAGRHADLQTLCMTTFGRLPDAIAPPGPTGAVLTAIIDRARMECAEERLIAMARRHLADTGALRALAGRRFPDRNDVRAVPPEAGTTVASADIVLEDTRITESNASVTVVEGKPRLGTKGTLTIRGSVIEGSTMTIVGVKT